MVIMATNQFKSYSELILLPTFEERFEYLKLDGQIGIDTFGHDRYLNQILYKTYEWQQARNEVILRDNGCDLGSEDRIIFGKIIVHHMNPISIDDINRKNPDIFNPEFLITTTLRTHNAIHYGNADNLLKGPILRTMNDTCPWKN